MIEEMAEEGELEAKDKGFLLPVSSGEGRRPHSAPQSSLARHISSSSLSSLTQGHFRATKADYFRSDGRWRLVLEVYDKWTRESVDHAIDVFFFLYFFLRLWY